MDFSGRVKCTNCGKNMEPGFASSVSDQIVQFRNCDCGMSAIFYHKVEGYEYKIVWSKLEKLEKQ